MIRVYFENDISRGYLHCEPVHYHLVVARLLKNGFILINGGTA